MTAILNPQQPVDFNPNFYNWNSNDLNDFGDMDSLSALFPDPPSQPPPDSHGPPILSSNEMSQFSSHIEALTSKYKHTANWRDPPRKTNFSHRRASTTQVSEFGSMEMPYSIDQYHGTLNGLLSNWPNQSSQQHLGSFSSTIAPHQLQNAPTSNHHRRNNSESMLNTANVLETLGINVPEMKNFIGSILSASHPSFSAPFFTEGVPPEEQAILLPPELASLNPNGDVATTTTSSHPYPAMQSQAPVAFGSDVSFKSAHFNAPNNLADMDHNLERTFQDYGLEPEPSPLNSPRSMSLDEHAILSPTSLKRKSFSISGGDNTGVAHKRNRLSLHLDNPFQTEKKASPSRSPARDILSPRSKSHGTKSPFDVKHRGKKYSPRPRLSESQKKENHKASEAKRRERVVIAQNRLWSLLPDGSGKPSQRMRLEQTMDHMKAVKAGNESLRMQLMRIQCA